MKIHAFTFDTEIEAIAFVEGIEFVDDNSIEIESMLIDESGHGFTVTLLEYELDDGDDDCEKKHCECE